MASEPILNMPTHLIAIGFTSGMRCYLGLTELEAQTRYLEETGEEDLVGLKTKRIEIKDGMFNAYDVWAE